MKQVKIIEDALKEVLASFNVDVDCNITKPTHAKFGDYSTNVALLLAKQLKDSPMNISQKIVTSLKLIDTMRDIDIAIVRPGFINFSLSRKILEDIVMTVLHKGQSYCSSITEDKDRPYIVEYSSPNIAKPFTIGHLRSTIIGDAIARILIYTGHRVTRDNHLGDWGTQFGKMIVAIKKWGDEKSLDKSKEPIKDLVELYQRFHKEAENNQSLLNEARAWFVRLEEKDFEATRIWQKCIQLSLTEFSRIYSRLGVMFDTYNGESMFGDTIPEVIEDLRSKKMLTESKGAQLVFFDTGTKLPPLMILKSDGSTLYATRDLATDKFRLKEYGNDVIIINEVGKEQMEYFKQIFAIEKMLGYFGDGQRYHIAHGHYRFAEGKMSTREGKVIWLDDVLNEAFSRVKTIAKEGSSNEDIEKIAIGALKFNDLNRSPSQDIEFDWDTVLNLKGDSGPYIQYTVVRIRSLIKKGSLSQRDQIILDEGSEIELARVLESFEFALTRAYSNFAPNYLAGYLIELARAYNTYYAQNQIILDSKNVHETGYMLSQATEQILTLGLSLLGIEIPEKM